MFGQINEIKDLAFKYSKQELGRMAQMGMIEPQKAMMAGMMRDRVAKEDTKPPTTTVAQDVLGMQPPQQAQAQSAPQMGMQQPQGVMQPQQPQQAQAPAGIESLPAGDVGNYAGGGIVAFADGGDTGYEYKFNPDTGEYTLISEKKKEIPVDTRQHLGAAGLGIFGSEGMDLMTGLPKGNMRDPVLGFAGGGEVPGYAGGDAWGSLVGGSGFVPGAADQRTLELMRASQQEESARAETMKQGIAQKMATGVPLTVVEQNLAARLNITPAAQTAPAYSGIVPQDELGSQSFNFAPPPVKDVAAALPQIKPQAREAAAAATAPKTDTAMKERPVTGAAPTGVSRLPAISRPDTKFKLEEISATPVPTLQELNKERAGYYKELGVDTDIYKGMIEKEEGKRGELGKRKEQARGEFLMNLGVGLMQAQKGRELAALGAGAVKGMADYKDAMKDLRASEDKLDDRLNTLRLADQQAKKTGADADINKRDSMLEKYRAAENENIKARNTAKMETAKIDAQLYGTEVQAQTSKDVAGIHVAGTLAAERLRQRAMPEIMKVADSKQMKEAMPNATFFERVQAYAQAAHPKNTQNSMIIATTQANKAANEEWADELQSNAQIRELKKKADAGDQTAIKQLRDKRDALDKYHLDKIYKETASTGVIPSEERAQALAFIQANPDHPSVPGLKTALGIK